jgi:hypothetical protein
MKQLPLQQDEDQLVRWNEDTLWSLVRAREKFSHSSKQKTVGQYSSAPFVIVLALRGAMTVMMMSILTSTISASCSFYSYLPPSPCLPYLTIPLL